MTNSKSLPLNVYFRCRDFLVDMHTFLLGLSDDDTLFALEITEKVEPQCTQPVSYGVELYCTHPFD